MVAHRETLSTPRTESVPLDRSVCGFEVGLQNSGLAVSGPTLATPFTRIDGDPVSESEPAIASDRLPGLIEFPYPP
ncbi:hypothetical protein [Halopiger goleimassiliensis]|uniref:hypothetical protein n=1 Tax=Halopiger goleimassiliensis TaxID=1293048 RepID=UPI000ABCD42F|nr:hypothetical protein [Halopiger goleimassiliensis]